MSARGPRHEARLKSQTFCETGLPCKHGQVAKRYVSTGRCHTCQSQEVVKMKAAGYPSQRAWEKRNKEQVRITRARYEETNRERILAYHWPGSEGREQRTLPRTGA